MTEATDTNPDLFPMGDFAGSGFDVGYPYGGEQSEPFFDDARVDPSETVGDQLDDWDVTAVNFAGSVLDGLHVFSSGEFQNALDRAWQSWSRRHCGRCLGKRACGNIFLMCQSVQVA